MIGRLNHVAIAVPDARAAGATYRKTLGATVSDAEPLPSQGVTTVFVELPNAKIEFIEPLGEDSVLRKYLARHPSGGLHHVCYEVDDILAARDKLLQQGATLTGSGEPSIGAHGKPVLFLHPKEFHGHLIELEQA